MKKLFLLAAGLALTLTACQKDEGLASGTPAAASFTVTIPHNGTRAVSDAFGTGTSANRCILEIYHGDQLYNRIVKPVSGKTVTFDNLRLVAQQTYDFVFWADCADGSDGNFTDRHYDTQSLKAISNRGTFEGNSDERDAFFAHETLSVTGSFSKPVTLRRPFGLLVVKTDDLGEIQDPTLRPTGYTVAFKGLPATFDALTGEVSGAADLTYTADELAKAADGTISMDFLWASEDEAALSDFTMTFLNNGQEIYTNDAFTNIPIRRNYRTVVSGNLLTKKGSVSVTINPQFSGEFPEQVIAEVSSAAEVEAALKEGATDIVVTTLGESNEIVIPQIYPTDNNTQISLSLPQTDKDVTIKYGDASTGQTGNTEAPANITITANTTGKTTIITPESTVTLRGSFGEIDATTADWTLIVPEGVDVAKLNVIQGNVEIYGKVAEITFGEQAGIVKTYAAGDAETLKKAAGLVAESKCARIVLTANIDLAGSADNLWEPINAENSVFTEFDGGNHTISNLYVDNYTGHADGKGHYYGGLFYVLRGTVKDLTIDKADITCFRGGALVGRMDHGSVENCHVKNVTLTGYQKVAGLVGFVSTGSKDVTIRNSSVEQCAIKTTAPEEGLFQAGGLIGYLQTFERNVLIEGNSVSGISFDKVYESAPDVADKIYDMEQYYSHAFIGTIANFSTKSTAYYLYKVELRDNTVAEQISGIPTCDRTDEYIGWWAGDCNAQGYMYAPKVVVNGVAKDRWIEVKRIYNILKAGGDITIYRDCDLTKCPDTKETFEIAAPTTLTLKAGTLTVGKSQIINKSQLTIRGEGTMTATANIINNEGKVTIDGGNFQATGTGDAAIVFNTGDVVINGGALESNGHYAIQNNYGKSVTINGGSITSKGGKDYCLLMHGSGVLTVTGGTLTGNFGCVRLHEGTSATISGGEFICNGQYYALFVGAYGTGVTAHVSGGKFRSTSTSAPNKCVYVNKNNTLDLTGGEFQNKGYDANISGDIAPAAGYVFADNDDPNYPFKVVAQ